MTDSSQPSLDTPLNHYHRRARRPEQLGKVQRRLERSRHHKVIAGIFGGIGKFVDMNPQWLRIFFVIGTILSLGVFTIGYGLLWWLLPLEMQAD